MSCIFANIRKSFEVHYQSLLRIVLREKFKCTAWWAHGRSEGAPGAPVGAGPSSSEGPSSNSDHVSLASYFQTLERVYSQMFRFIIVRNFKAWMFMIAIITNSKRLRDPRLKGGPFSQPRGWGLGRQWIPLAYPQEGPFAYGGPSLAQIEALG